MADKHDGIEGEFDRGSGISMVDLVSMGCPGNLIDLVCAFRSQPDTPLPGAVEAMAAVLFSFQFPEKILLDILDDFDAISSWTEGTTIAEMKFPGSRKFYLYFKAYDIRAALAVTRARAAAGISGWKHHHFADEYGQPPPA